MNLTLLFAVAVAIALPVLAAAQEKAGAGASASPRVGDVFDVSWMSVTKSGRHAGQQREYHLLIEVEGVEPDQRKIRGTINIQTGGAKIICSAPIPFSGDFHKNGAIEVRAEGDGVAQGCERRVRLRLLADGTYTGTLGSEGGQTKVTVIKK